MDPSTDISSSALPDWLRVCKYIFVKPEGVSFPLPVPALLGPGQTPGPRLGARSSAALDSGTGAARRERPKSGTA